MNTQQQIQDEWLNPKHEHDDCDKQPLMFKCLNCVDEIEGESNVVYDKLKRVFCCEKCADEYDRKTTLQDEQDRIDTIKGE